MVGIPRVLSRPNAYAILTSMTEVEKFKIDVVHGANDLFILSCGGLSVTGKEFKDALIKFAEAAEELGLYGGTPTEANYQLRTTGCRNCKAKIFFATKNGKALPFDPNPFSISEVLGIKDSLEGGPAPSYETQFPPRLYKLAMGAGDKHMVTLANKRDKFGLVCHLDVCGGKSESEIDEGLKPRWREHRKVLIGDVEQVEAELWEYLRE